jgi:hypothetical protein
MKKFDKYLYEVHLQAALDWGISLYIILEYIKPIQQ